MEVICKVIASCFSPTFVFQAPVTINATMQTAREGGMVVGDHMSVRAEHIANINDASGKVIMFGDNGTYNEALARE